MLSDNLQAVVQSYNQKSHNNELPAIQTSNQGSTPEQPVTQSLPVLMQSLQSYASWIPEPVLKKIVPVGNISLKT